MLSEERERLRGAADRTRGFIAFLMSDPRLAELGLAVADLTLLLEAVDALDTAERERDALRDVVGYAGREQRISANSLLNAIRERAEMVDLVQAHRPEGPPPPGGGARALLRWVLDTLALERDRAVGEARSAERERDEARAAKDVAYAERNRVVAALARMALGRSWRTGIRPHEPDPDPTWDEDWKNVVLINLPTGQVSWHYHDSDRPLFAWLPPYRWPWDGHDTAEKYRRLAALSLPPAENFEDAAHDAAAVRSLGEAGPVEETPERKDEPEPEAPADLPGLRAKAAALRELLGAARDYDGGVPGSARLVDAALALAHAVEVHS
jgi:hypothetical protein